MKPHDRMTQLASQFRPGKAITAQELSQALSVSLRTIYRDIAALRATGAKIDGEAGVGYMLRGQA